jgi:ABC-type lipoprotein export system ATPase subunit
VGDEKEGIRQPAKGVLDMMRLDDITKSYGAIKVIKNFSFNVEVKKLICVVGQSGCGKTTLLKVMALIAKPDQGSITIDGTKVNTLNETKLAELRSEKISYSFQEPLLIPYMSTIENLTEVIGAEKEHAVELLSRLGLSERINHKSSKLSTGEKKRVDIARALLRESRILIADEPLSNLDPSTGLEVMTLLREHAQNGGMVIYSSVQPSDARFADIIVDMSERTFINQNSPVKTTIEESCR